MFQLRYDMSDGVVCSLFCSHLSFCKLRNDGGSKLTVIHKTGKQLNKDKIMVMKIYAVWNIEELSVTDGRDGVLIDGDQSRIRQMLLGKFPYLFSLFLRLEIIR